MSDTVFSPSHRDLVVIGASAGGVETLKQIVAQLPSDLPAAICVVLHLSPASPSALAAILGRAGPLPCHAAADGDALREGHIVVAPPDHHLVVEDRHVRLTVGPRENNHRPSVDVLFRSAAEARGQDVIGVILSGTRDDGTAGLAVIKARGGLTLVQDPGEALYPGMPLSAIAHVAVDAVVPLGRIAETITAMVNGDGVPDPPASEDAESEAPEDSSAITICPECGGVLTERREAGTLHWQCRVGHRYSPETLVEAQRGDVEAALWTAVRALDDRGLLLRRISHQLAAAGQTHSVRRFERRAADAERQADLVRGALAEAARTSLREVAEDEAESAGRESVA